MNRICPKAVIFRTPTGCIFEAIVFVVVEDFVEHGSGVVDCDGGVGMGGAEESCTVEETDVPLANSIADIAAWTSASTTPKSQKIIVGNKERNRGNRGTGSKEMG